MNPCPDYSLAINVTDLDKTISFYIPPVRHRPREVKPGYANFVIADLPLKLVLFGIERERRSTT